MHRIMKNSTHLLIAVLAGVFVSVATAALANPTTYRGKLGTIDIVVELNIDPLQKGPIAGRYAYMSKGVDIPLQSVARKGKSFELAEEEACGAEKCGDGQKPPIGATWTLAANADGSLSGTWKSAKRSLPLQLSRVGSREDMEATTPLALYQFSDELTYSEDSIISIESSPYDYTRNDVPVTTSQPEGFADAKFAYAVDPRTKFRMPRVVRVEGGSAGSANDLLKQRHWRNNISAWSCAAMQYIGLNDFGGTWSSDGGSLGGWDSEFFTEVHALTPKVMSWQESGSLFCHGAHPYNFRRSYTMDVAVGRLLGLGDMFADVQDNLPGESLVGFVRDRRPKPTAPHDIEYEQDCGIDDLIAQNLTASLKRDAGGLKLVFALEGLPHVIAACEDDLFEVPVAEVADLMTNEFHALLGL